MNIEVLEKVLDLEDFIADEIEIDNKNLLITGYLKRKEHICPRCNSITREVKDIRIQLIKDIKAFDKNVIIKLKKQRYICRRCNKSFYEQNSWLKKHQRTTTRFIELILRKCANVSSFKSISEDLEIPLTTLIRKFDLLEYPKSNLKNLEVLSIDEFKGNTGG